MRHLSLIGLAMFAGSGISAASAQAQTGREASGSGVLQEVIVTAQKRVESLQDTPISIAVLGDEELEKKGVTNLADFSTGLVPSVRITPLAGRRSSSLLVTMRGVTPGDISQVSRDPTVGVYVDGVYLGRAQGLGTEMFDLERIEVLRGPQGTLFGRNAVGGAISMVSKRPTGRFGGDVTAGIRNFDGQHVDAHIDLPEFSGLSIKLDGVWSKRDGWVDNPMPGQSDWHEYHRRGGRISALWRPTDDLEVLYSFDISRDASTSGYPQNGAFLPGAPPLPPILALEPNRVRTARVGVQLEPGVGKVHGHGLHISWELGEHLTFRSISAMRKVDQTQSDNAPTLTVPFSPNGDFARLSYAKVDQKQWSQEFQLLGSYERLKFVAGAFYFKEEGQEETFAQFTARFNATGTGYTSLPVNIGGPTYPERRSLAKTTSKALFGQATFTPPLLDDRLHLTGGLRWTHDSKRGALTGLRGAIINIPFRFESKRVDPAFTLAFDWTDDVNSYVRWGRAYRAGGANSRSAIYRSYGEEVMSTWEVGAKADFLDRRARLNVAAFRSRYTDRQVDFPNPANPSSTETVNAPEPATIKGLEIDFTLLPVRGLTLSGSYVYTDWSASIDISPFSGLPQIGAITYTPKHAATASIDYEFPPLSFGTVSAHVDVIYSSTYFTGGALHPTTTPDTTVNARLTLGEIKMGRPDGNLALSLWAKNLTNVQFHTYDFGQGGPGRPGLVGSQFNEPRTYGLDARFTF